jgi:hypothetical protein
MAHGRWVQVATIGVASVLMLVSVACTAPVPGVWAPQEMPASGFAAGQQSTRFTAVDCGSPTACLAIGSAGGTVDADLYLRWWDGSTWRPVENPQGLAIEPYLASVACAGSWCIVGGQAGTVWSYDGTRWAQHPIDAPNGILRPSCASPTMCLAIGRGQVMRWDGATWANATPELSADTQLGALQCVPGGTSCILSTEDLTTTWLDRWDGSGWTRLTTVPASVTSFDSQTLRCPAPDHCISTSVDIFFEGPVYSVAYAHEWKQGRWSTVRLAEAPRPVLVGFHSLECGSGDSCVGRLVSSPGSDDDDLLVRRQGGTWTTTPLQPGQGPKRDLSCPAAGFCATVDWEPADGTNGVTTRGVLAVGDGVTWREDRPVGPPAPAADVLGGVSCVEVQPNGRGAGNAWCVAVGSGRVNGRTQSLVTVWDGTAWRVTTRPGPEADEVSLTDVACPAIRQCVAVGVRVRDYVSTNVVRVGDGTTWQDVDLSGTANVGPVGEVSCTGPDFCLAAGVGVLIREGTGWRAAPGLGSPNISVAELSCLSPTRCLGRTVVPPLGPENLAVWNGQSWIGTTRLVDGRTLTGGGPLACSPGLTCHALAQVQDPVSRLSAPVFVTGDGMNLSATTAPNLFVRAEAMACDRVGACLAVAPPLPADGQLTQPGQAWRWTGFGWSPTAPPSRPTPFQHAARLGLTTDLACVPGWCVLVGRAPAPGATGPWSGTSPSVPYAEGYSY